MKWLQNKEKGQSLVEFTLVLPILLILLLGIVVFGQIFFSYMVIQNASRDAARYGSVGATDIEINQIIQSKTTSLNQANIAVTINPSPSLRNHGEQIEVQVGYNVPLFTPMWSSILPNPFPITAKTVMRIE